LNCRAELFPPARIVKLDGIDQIAPRLPEAKSRRPFGTVCDPFSKETGNG
jgi:hypothetical protein